MKGFQCLATLFAIIQLGLTLPEASPKKPETFGKAYNERKYAEFMNFIKLPIPKLPFSSFIPGYDCLTKPEWPGTTRFRFECNVTPASNVVPDNVHVLRPADIKVIGAMGDSLTAANGAGACVLPQLAMEYRGKSFSHGGDKTFEKVPTLANILKKFNPRLKGYGVSTGRWDSSNAGFNVGYPGEVSADMPAQAHRLVAKMRGDRSINFNKDWKLVTMFIGANDLCDWCKDKALYSPQVYVDNIMKALRILQQKLPRTLVNVVGVLNVPEVGALRGPVCSAVQMILCDCAMFLNNNDQNTFAQVTKEYQRRLEAAIGSGVLDGRPDFTAVLQPFLHNTGVPLKQGGSPDFSYFSPDCFHFSSKGHATAGIELWNNMMEPVGSKRTTWVPGGPMTCPTRKMPYIYTNVNSQAGFLGRVQRGYSSSTKGIHNISNFHLLLCAFIVYFMINYQ